MEGFHDISLKIGCHILAPSILALVSAWNHNYVLDLNRTCNLGNRSLFVKLEIPRSIIVGRSSV